MSTKPNLLVKDNLVRHLSSKIEKLKGISNIIFTIDEPPILESLLALAVSYFEAAIVDTVREYVYAKPDEIYKLMLQKFDKKRRLFFSNYIDDWFTSCCTYPKFQKKEGVVYWGEGERQKNTRFYRRDRKKWLRSFS